MSKVWSRDGGILGLRAARGCSKSWVVGPARAKVSAAFSLIELLIVLAIIAIIAAMLMPGLGKGKSSAKSASCMSNLRQLQAAWVQYVDDNNDRLPPNISRSTGPAGAFRQNVPQSWVLGNARFDTGPNTISGGLLFHYTPALAVFRCPEDRSGFQNHPDALRYRSYSMNCWLNGDSDPTDYYQDWANPGNESSDKTKLSQLAQISTSKVFGFIDEHEQSIDDGCMVVSNPADKAPDVWYKLPSDRHAQGCNISFVDGHVEHWRWKWRKRFQLHGEDVERAARDPQGCDLQDLRKLQSCIPKP